MKSAKGWSSHVGQYRDHSSYMLRPRRTVSCVPITSPRFACSTSSQSNRNVLGSSATPSTDTNMYATTLRMLIPSPPARCGPCDTDRTRQRNSAAIGVDLCLRVGKQLHDPNAEPQVHLVRGAGAGRPHELLGRNGQRLP